LKQYTSINDAAQDFACLAAGTTQIWHAKIECAFLPYSVFLLRTGKVPLAETHVQIGCVAGADLDELSRVLQCENWSPNGEARDLVAATKTHTSFSLGDVIVMDNVRYYRDLDDWVVMF
jgi:hypothetical protein